jgi:hypothetical protein
MNRLFHAAAASAAVVFCAPGARAQAVAFDGAWSVLVITDRGGCERTRRFPVIVENGRPRYAGLEALTVAGQVGANGGVRGTIAQGPDRAYVTGRLGGPFGQGTWTASGGQTCAGRWNAEKRG